MKTKLFLIAASSLMAVGVASAQDLPEISGNVAMTTDYRFRGLSLSDNDFAVQGGFDAAFDGGLYVGTWASNIDTFAGSEVELDLYGGYGFEANGVALDIGAIVYMYPDSSDTHYFEVYGSAGTTVGIADVAVGFAYAPEQENIGDDDNTYFYLDGGLPLGDSPFSVAGHVGYEDGAFGFDDGKVDYSIGVATSAAGVDLDLSLVGTDLDSDDYGDIIDTRFVFTVSKSL